MTNTAAPLAPTQDAVKAWQDVYQGLQGKVQGWSVRLSEGRLPLSASEQVRLRSLTTAVQSLTPMPTGNAQVAAAIIEGSLEASKLSLDATMKELPRHVKGSMIGAGVPFGWDNVSNPAVAASIINGGVGQMTADWAKLNVQVQDTIRKELAVGITVGENSRVIAKNIDNSLGSQMALGQRRSVMISRTVTAAAYDQATQSTFITAYNDGLIFGWEWSASGDYRTCRICNELNGQLFPAAEATFRHPNCRCAMIPVLTDAGPRQDFYDEATGPLFKQQSDSGWTQWAEKPGAFSGPEDLSKTVAKGRKSLKGRNFGSKQATFNAERDRQLAIQRYRYEMNRLDYELQDLHDNGLSTAAGIVKRDKMQRDYKNLLSDNPRKWVDKDMEADLRTVTRVGQSARRQHDTMMAKWVEENPIGGKSTPVTLDKQRQIAQGKWADNHIDYRRIEVSEDGREWLQAVQHARRDANRQIVEEYRGTDPTAVIGRRWTERDKRVGYVPSDYRPLAPEKLDWVNDSFRAYPKEWTDAYKAYNPDLTVGRAKRASYMDDLQSLSVSSYADRRLPEIDQIKSVAMHEIGHGMEQAVPGLKDMEMAFWMKRVKGSVTDQSEVGYFKKDKGDFALSPKNPTRIEYSMKRYYALNDVDRSTGKTDGLEPHPYAAFENFTTGVQDILGDGRNNYTLGDEDFYDFVMGALLLL